MTSEEIAEMRAWAQVYLYKPTNGCADRVLRLCDALEEMEQAYLAEQSARQSAVNAYIDVERQLTETKQVLKEWLEAYKNRPTYSSDPEEGMRARKRLDDAKKAAEQVVTD